jgi:hypothetical protein
MLQKKRNLRLFPGLFIYLTSSRIKPPNSWEKRLYLENNKERNYGVNKMRIIFTRHNIGCNQFTCGECAYRDHGSKQDDGTDWSECVLFKFPLNNKIERLSECLKAEERANRAIQATAFI